jgi:hypothetical protein
MIQITRNLMPISLQRKRSILLKCSVRGLKLTSSQLTRMTTLFLRLTSLKSTRSKLLNLPDPVIMTVTPCLSQSENAIKPPPTRPTSVRISRTLRKMRSASGNPPLLLCQLIVVRNSHLANGLTCTVRLARQLES